MRERNVCASAGELEEGRAENVDSSTRSLIPGWHRLLNALRAMDIGYALCDDA